METSNLIVLCFSLWFGAQFLISVVATISITAIYRASTKLIRTAQNELRSESVPMLNDILEAQNVQLGTLRQSLYASSANAIVWLIAECVLLVVVI